MSFIEGVFKNFPDAISVQRKEDGMSHTIVLGTPSRFELVLDKKEGNQVTCLNCGTILIQTSDYIDSKLLRELYKDHRHDCEIVSRYGKEAARLEEETTVDELTIALAEELAFDNARKRPDIEILHHGLADELPF